VSAIINAKPGISPATTLRVKDAIQELGYRPYSVARSLRTGHTHTIAFIVTDINNPSFSTIASAAEDIVHGFGYNLVLFNTHDDPEREASYLHTVSDRWIDGVIFVATGDVSTSLESLQKAKIPTVTIDRIPMGYSGPSVTLDNYKAGFMAADHLLRLGHNLFAHISGPQKLHLARERLSGFRDCLNKANIPWSDLNSLEGNWTYASGYEAMKQILKWTILPTAVFAGNDRMAIGAIQAITEIGWKVPEDISVVGVDDIESAAFNSPALTTIRQSFPEMASRCVHLLLEILEGKEPSQLQIVIEPNLIERKSTSQPRDVH
jgi:LacI family transcriptional regulator